MKDPYELRIECGGQIWSRRYADKAVAVELAIRIHIEDKLNCLVCDLRDMSCVVQLEGGEL